MPEGQTEFDLSVVTVSWNVRDLLRSCLQSVQSNCGDLKMEMIVVDSASSDGSAEMVRQEFPWVKLIASDENLGFPRANNLGIAAASGRHLMLLNPDTIVLGDALPTMVDYLDLNLSVGCVGPQLLNTDGSVQSSRRRFPTLLTGLFESTWLQPKAPARLLTHYYALDLPDNEQNDVDWVTGACMMVPQRVADIVGPLDEAYFMYSEELDWCRRIKDAGWRVVYLPSAQVIHHSGKSSEQAITARHVHFQQAKLRYFRKYHGRLATGLLRVSLLANYVWQLSTESFKALLGHKRPLRRQRIRSYWQVIRSGLPPAGY